MSVVTSPELFTQSITCPIGVTMLETATLDDIVAVGGAELAIRDATVVDKLIHPQLNDVIDHVASMIEGAHSLTGRNRQHVNAQSKHHTYGKAGRSRRSFWCRRLGGSLWQNLLTLSATMLQ